MIPGRNLAVARNLARYLASAAIPAGRFTVAGTLTLGLALPILGGPPALADNRLSVWSGIYTDAQASRGAALYPGPCGKCHGAKLDGAPDDPDMESTPPVAGPKFLRDWNDRSLAALYQYVRTRMPENNPGFLSEQEFVDIVAYMLFVSGAPAGDEMLRGDVVALSNIAITASAADR